MRVFTRRVYARNNLHLSAYRTRLINNKVSLETLEIRRAKSDLILMYKMFHSLVEIPIEWFFVRRNYNHNMRSHHPYTIQSKVHSKCRVMQDSYFNRVVNVWNNLPDICVLSKSLPVFRSRLDMIGERKADCFPIAKLC